MKLIVKFCVTFWLILQFIAWGQVKMGEVTKPISQWPLARGGDGKIF